MVAGHRLAAVAPLVVLIGCGEWKPHGNGQAGQLYFESGHRRVTGEIGVRIGDVSDQRIRVARQEFRSDAVQLNLHGGRSGDTRYPLIDVDDAHCEPAALCTIEVGAPSQWVELTLHPRTPGPGLLVVTARVSPTTRVSDRAAILVLAE
jgi:hypothetical protein